MKRNTDGTTRRGWRAVTRIGLAWAAPIFSFGQEVKILPSPPAGESINGPALRAAVHASLACAVSNLLTNAETNWDNLFLEPFTKGYATTNRTSWKTVDEPIYEYAKYDTFELRSGASSADGKNLEKVTHQRIVKVIGTNKVDRWVPDPNGTNIVIWVQPTTWQPGFLGQNGLALYTVLKAGVPETQPVLAKHVETMCRYLQTYGLPDGTFDLAWLTAAFSNLKGRDGVAIRAKLVNKLLMGQIADGPARGLWGPVSVNQQLLSVMLAHEQSLGQDVAKRKALAAKTSAVAPDAKRKMMPKDPGAEGQISALQSLYPDVTMLGLSFDTITSGVSVGPDGDKILVCGLPFYLYDQSLADLEMTAVALFALKEAALNKALPEETAPPRLSPKQPTLIPAEKTSGVIWRAITAITALQKSDGMWDEGNFHQPEAYFSACGLGPAGKDKVCLSLGKGTATKEKVLNLASTNSFLSFAQAYAALVDAGQILGLPNALGRLGNNFRQGRTLGVTLAARFLDNQPNGLALSHWGLPYDATIGAVPTPYDLLCKFTGIERLYGTRELCDWDLWRRGAYSIVQMQDEQGWWGGNRSMRFYSSSVFARQEALFQRRHAETQEKLPPNKREPYPGVKTWANFHWFWQENNKMTTLCTAYAAIFLLDGAREPLVGYLEGQKESGFPKIFSAAIGGLERQKGVSLDYVGVSSRTSAAALHSLPVLYLRNETLATNLLMAAKVKEYACAGSGLLLVEIAGGAVNNLAAILNDAKLRNVPDAEPFWADFKGTRPKLQGLYTADNRLVAVFLPVAQVAAPESAELLAAQAVQVTQLAIEKQAPAGYFAADYPIRCSGDVNPYEARVTALHALATAPAL